MTARASEPISAAEHAARRAAFVAAMQPGSVAIVRAGGRLEVGNDTFHRFRPTSHFRYLTGLVEPDAYLVLRRPLEGAPRFVLFTQPPQPEREAWQGPRVGVEGACARYGADEAHEVAALGPAMIEALRDATAVYYCFGQDAELHAQVGAWLREAQWGARRGRRAATQLVHAETILGELRCRKSAAELAIMREAIDVTEEAILAAMRRARPGAHEHELEAEVLHAFARRGARPAFAPMVSAGCSGTLSHHRERNDARLQAEALVIVDVGAELEGYCADLTATFPASGRFSPRQRALYELVLGIERWLVGKVGPGVTFGELEAGLAERIVEGLLSIGVLEGEPSRLLEQQVERRFMMHNPGHWLGLDIHDETSYALSSGQWRPFVPGMVLTAEPGLYVRPGTPGVDRAWWNLGARVEDDVLVTETGHEVLSCRIPRTVSEIEATMGAAP